MAEYADDDFDEDDDDNPGVLSGSGLAAGLCPNGNICLIVVDDEYRPMTGVALTANEAMGVIEMLEKCLARQGEERGG